MDRATQFAVAATQEAMRHAKLDMSQEDPWEVGCLIGTGIGGIETLLEQSRVSLERGYRVVSPLLIPMMIPDNPTGRTAIEFNLRGPNMSISTACATGNNAIGEAAEIIRRCSADVMIAGSTEAAIVPLALAAFANMGALSHRNDDPTTASRPFDATRDGFVMGEGCGILILEALEHALARGATIYGEILGYGNTDDAHHVTAPLENGEGARVAMQKAIRSAGLRPEQIDYVNAHGTGTPLNDSAETRAMKDIWGEKAAHLKISSIKGATGHLLGAAGSLEAIISLLTMHHSYIPPTINLHTPDPVCDLDYTPNVGIDHAVHTVMSSSFGFGGHNAVLVMGKYTANGHPA